MSVVPFSSTVSTYTNVFTQLGDGKFDLGDITAPVAAGMDVMGWVCDPMGALAGAALGPLLDWLSNNFVILKEPLDLLAGDQAEIMAKSQEWSNLANAVVQAGNDHAATAGDLPNWTQGGSAEYRQLQKDINAAFQATATQCASVANSIQVAGQVCAGVRQFIWDIVKGFITSAIGNALAALAVSIATGGGSVAAFVAWFQGKFAWVQGKILGKLSELASWASKATSRWKGLSSKLDDAANALKAMSKKKFSSSGGFSSSASRKTGGRVKVKEIDKPTFASDGVKDKWSDIKDPLKKTNGPLNAADKAGDKYDQNAPIPTPRVNTIP